VHLHAIALDDGCRRFAAKHLVVRARITAYSSKAKIYRLVADLVVRRVSELNSNDADLIGIGEHCNRLTTLLTVVYGGWYSKQTIVRSAFTKSA
jgi:hypothetical protein